MSVRNAFDEGLKKLGIDPIFISRVEIREGSKLYLHTHYGAQINVKDPSMLPYLLRTAKLSTLENPFEELTRDELVKRMYGTSVVFHGLNESYQEFKERMMYEPTQKIAKELARIEGTHVDKNYQDCLRIQIQSDLIKKNGEERKKLGIILSFEKINEEMTNLTTENLLDALINIRSVKA